MPLLAWSSQARGFFTPRAAPELREDAELVRCWYAEDNWRRRERAFALAQEVGTLAASTLARKRWALGTKSGGDPGCADLLRSGP